MQKELEWIRMWLDEKLKHPDAISSEELIIYMKRNFVRRKDVEKLYEQYELMAKDIKNDIQDLRRSL